MDTQFNKRVQYTYTSPSPIINFEYNKRRCTIRPDLLLPPPHLAQKLEYDWWWADISFLIFLKFITWNN